MTSRPRPGGGRTAPAPGRGTFSKVASLRREASRPHRARRLGRWSNGEFHKMSPPGFEPRSVPPKPGILPTELNWPAEVNGTGKFMERESQSEKGRRLRMTKLLPTEVSLIRGVGPESHKNVTHLKGAGIEPGSHSCTSRVLPTELEEATQNDPRKALNQSLEAETSCHEILTNTRGALMPCLCLWSVLWLVWVRVSCAGWFAVLAGQLCWLDCCSACWFVRCAG